MRLAIDGVVSFTTFPLRIWTLLGVALSTASALYMLVIIFRTLVYGSGAPGYASIMTVLLFFNGMIMINLGILGEYIARIFTEVKGRPVYLVKPMPGLELAFGLDEPAAVAPAGRLGPPVRVRGAVTETAPGHPAGIVFGERLELVGFDLAPARARPGEVQQIVLYWRALGPLDRNYVISVQLIGADGAKAGQKIGRAHV